MPVTRRQLALLLGLLGLLAGSCTSAGPPVPRLTVVTGTRGGVYDLLGSAYAREAARRWDVPARSRRTAAAVANLRLVASGAADVGLTTADAASLAMLGHAPFDEPLHVAALAALYDDEVQVVVPRSSSLTRLRQLSGLRVSTGPVDSGTELIADRLLRIVGLDPGHDVRVVHLGADEAARALRAGRIDAFIFSGGVPLPAVTELSRTFPVSLVPLDQEAELVRQRYGDVYSTRTVPASAYALPVPVPTVAVTNLLIARPDLDRAEADALTGLVFTSREQLTAASPAATAITRRTATSTYPVPLAPGAAAYYRRTKPDVD